MDNYEVIIITLRKMGVEPTFELVKNINLTYHSCALAGSELTLIETTKAIAELTKDESKRQ